MGIIEIQAPVNTEAMQKEAQDEIDRITSAADLRLLRDAESKCGIDVEENSSGNGRRESSESTEPTETDIDINLTIDEKGTTTEEVIKPGNTSEPLPSIDPTRRAIKICTEPDCDHSEEADCGHMKPNWLHCYLQYTAKQESPTMFHVFTALSMIAGAVQHRVKLHRGYYDLMPNLYITLVAESALCKKSTAVEIGAFTFLDKLPRANLLSGTLTAAGLTDALIADYESNGMTISPNGAAFVLASELTYSLHEGTERDRFLRMIVDYYGGRSKSHDITRGEGRKEVERACINFLAATTPKSLTEVITNSVVGIGLIGRIIWISQERGRKRKAWPKKTEEMVTLEKQLLHDLFVLATLKGKFTVTPEAESFYQYWYEEVMPSPDEAKTPYEREYLGRKGEHVLKIAMVLSLNSSNDLIIDVEHIEKALSLLSIVEKDMWRAFKLVGSDTNMLAVDIMQLMSKRPSYSITMSQIIAAFRTRIKKKEDIKAALDLLEEEGLITKRLLPTMKKVQLILTEDGIKLLFGRENVEVLGTAKVKGKLMSDWLYSGGEESMKEEEEEKEKHELKEKKKREDEEREEGDGNED